MSIPRRIRNNSGIKAIRHRSRRSITGLELRQAREGDTDKYRQTTKRRNAPAISDDQEFDLIRKWGYDHKATQDFLERWSLPSDPNRITRSLEHLCQHLMNTPHEEWRKLPREYSQWMGATITRVIKERARQNSIWKRGPNIRIDPYALASMKIEFVREKAREDPQVDYLSVRDTLYRLFGEVSEAEEIYSIGRRDIKAREKEDAIRQEKIQREEQKKKMRDRVTEGNQSAKKELEKLKRREEFGMISNHNGSFKKHAKDYISVIVENPQDWESFERLLSSVYKDRTGNYRARLTRDRIYSRTDKFVWRILEESRTSDGSDITAESAASILALAVHTGSGMSPEESLELVRSICQ